MPKACPWVLLAAIAGGCAETVSAEKFLYMYRRSASPGHMEDGWYADYKGKDDRYHYLKVQYSTLDRGADQVFRYGGFREDVLRCPLAALPYDFPEGFQRVYEEGRRVEPEDATWRYVREYLSAPPASQPATAAQPVPAGPAP